MIAAPAAGTRPEPPSGAGPTPAAAFPVAAAGVPGCPLCGGGGRLTARPVTGDEVLDGWAVETPCPCTTAPRRRRDRRVLAALAEHVREQGWPPTLSELAGRTRLSRAQAYRSLLALEMSGHIERDPGKVERGLRLVSS